MLAGDVKGVLHWFFSFGNKGIINSAKNNAKKVTFNIFIVLRRLWGKRVRGLRAGMGRGESAGIDGGIPASAPTGCGRRAGARCGGFGYGLTVGKEKPAGRWCLAGSPSGFCRNPPARPDGFRIPVAADAGGGCFSTCYSQPRVVCLSSGLELRMRDGMGNTS